MGLLLLALISISTQSAASQPYHYGVNNGCDEDKRAEGSFLLTPDSYGDGEMMCTFRKRKRLHPNVLELDMVCNVVDGPQNMPEDALLFLTTEKAVIMFLTSGGVQTLDTCSL